MNKFVWGDSFFQLNIELMDRYAECADSDEVLAVQEEYMARGKKMFRDIAEGDSEGEEEEEAVPWFMQGAEESSEEEYEHEAEPAAAAGGGGGGESEEELVPDLAALDLVDVSISPTKEPEEEAMPAPAKEKKYKRAL